MHCYQVYLFGIIPKLPVSFHSNVILLRLLATYYKVNLDVLNSLILRFRCSGIFVCRGCPVVLLLIVLCCAADCPYLCTVVVVCVVCRVRGSLHTITPTVPTLVAITQYTYIYIIIPILPER